MFNLLIKPTSSRELESSPKGMGLKQIHTSFTYGYIYENNNKTPLLFVFKGFYLN